MTFRQQLALLLVLLLAAYFRFHLITVMPGGLFPDEAANGLDILSMQRGDVQPFYERGNGREALFFYLLWGSVELFGKGPWQHHIVSAAVGVLSVLACFLAARRLLSLPDFEDPKRRYQATWIAILAAFLMSVSSWHVVLSRTAFRANLIPLFSALVFYFSIAAVQTKGKALRYLLAGAAGMVFGLGFYSYIAYRVLVPILAGLVLWPVLTAYWNRGLGDVVRRWWRPAAVFLVVAALTLAPLLHYFYTHPGSFVGRSGQVSVFNPDLNQGHLWSAVWEVSRLSVLGYFTEGDLNWRHNVSGEPFLSSLVSPFFAVSLVVGTLLAFGYLINPKRRSGWWKYAALVGWFWGMLLPVVTTAEGIPHGLRSIGTIPAVFILSSLGLYHGYRLIYLTYRRAFGSVQGSLQRLGQVVLPFVAAFVLVALVVQTYYLYFVKAYSSPENAYAFRSDLTVVNRYLTDRCRPQATYLVLDKFSVQTVDYVTTVDARTNHPCNRPYVQVDPEKSWELSGLKDGDEVVFTQSSIFDIKKFKANHPEAHLSLEVRNRFGQAVMAVYRITTP